MASPTKPAQHWAVVHYGVDTFYWREVTSGWTIQRNACSWYPSKAEAESKALLLTGKYPAMIGKMHIVPLYGDDPVQGSLFK